MFTNWLTSDTPSNRESLNPLPDVVIEVGPPPFTRLPAHSTVLTSQSGFFRAAMNRANESGKQPENTIFLPNITVDHFTPLLAYMYHGYLELNFENIFGVLLATHLLHMPRALEICRDFLAHTQSQRNDFYSSAVPQPLAPSSSTSATLVRPIASKASNLGLNFISPPKAPSCLLLPSLGTPFRSINDLADEKPQKIIKLDEAAKEREEKKSLKKLHHTSKTLQPQSSKKVTENSTQEAGDCEKVIIDIASCDGPVRFRRILNEAYELNKKAPPVAAEAGAEGKYQPSNALSFHQQMVRNINEQYSKQKSISSQNSEESENSQLSNELYTCVYCNHTFKSKYCYQKHAKRHINPLATSGKLREDCESSDGDVKKSSSEMKRDSIKPLDMNVQYYPCKTCGCKFPSYYFVHKHRKLCHPEIAADGTVHPVSSDNMESSLAMESEAPAKT